MKPSVTGNSRGKGKGKGRGNGNGNGGNQLATNQPSNDAFSINRNIPPSLPSRFGPPIGLTNFISNTYEVVPPMSRFGPPIGFTNFPSNTYGAVSLMSRYGPPVAFTHFPNTDGVVYLVPTPAVIAAHVRHQFWLRAKIVVQVDYYFSFENLIKDLYLRKHMDDEGWVPIQLIAGFKRMSLFKNDIPFILAALRTSTTVEVGGDKIRKRIGWKRWILPHSFSFPDNQTDRSSSSSSSV